MLLPLLFSLFLSTVYSSATGELFDRDISLCAAELPVIQVYIYNQIVSYPVIIDTYISANTIININGGVHININNAPVYLTTTVMATTTSTFTSTSIVSATATAAPTAAPFMISFAPPAVQKRESSSTFIGAGGQTTTDCTNATVWTLVSGQLLSGGLKISTNGLANQPFAVPASYGNISTVFQISGTQIQWINPAFVGGSAIFYLLNNIVWVSFDGQVGTGGIVEVMQMVPASSCVSKSASSTLTPSATPTPTTFAIQASGGGIDGQFAQVMSLNDTFDDSIITFAPSAVNASEFSLNANGNLLDMNGDMANQDAVSPNITNGYPLFLNPPNIITDHNFTLPICAINANDILTCAETDGRNMMQYCPQNQTLFLDFVVQSNCSLVTLTAVPPSNFARIRKRLLAKIKGRSSYHKVML